MTTAERVILKAPFEIYREGVDIGDANGYVCTAENPEIAAQIVAALTTSHSPASGGEWRPTLSELEDTIYEAIISCEPRTGRAGARRAAFALNAKMFAASASPSPSVTEEEIARAICCPGTCLRGHDDCWAGRQRHEKEQARAVLALIRGERRT